jgi:hypothetical protein
LSAEEAMGLVRAGADQKIEGKVEIGSDCSVVATDMQRLFVCGTVHSAFQILTM